MVLVGANGAGKTNLLEALSFLAPGRGLRRARLDEVCRRTPQRGAGSNAPGRSPPRCDTPDGRLAIGTGLEPAESEASLPRRRGAHRRPAGRQPDRAWPHVAAVWLTPQMDRLFLDGPGERRRFLDRLVSALDPEHAGDVAAYEHALRQRARLLREGNRDPAWLAALEDTMARHGVAAGAPTGPTPCSVSTRRRGWASAPSRAPRSPWRARSMAGSPRWPALAAEDRLRAELAASRLRDAEAGTTSCRAASLRPGGPASRSAICRPPRARPASKRRC